MGNKYLRSFSIIVGLLIILALATGCGANRSPMLAGESAGGFATRGDADTADYDDGFYEQEMAEEGYDMGADEAMAPAEPMPDVSNVTNTSIEKQVQERLIIRDGYIAMSVEDTKATEGEIDSLVAQMAGEGAFIVSREQSGGSGNQSPYIMMFIRVPVDKFDETMDAISNMAAEGTTPTQSESGQDVTAEYVDLQAQLESLEVARDRLLELMENAATTEELLMAEQQLTQREREIDSIKGRMKYLSESAHLSSIRIELSPYILSQPVDTRWRPAETVRRAVDNLIDSLRGFADFLIRFTISVLPWLLLFGFVAYLVIRFIVQRIRRALEKRDARKAAQTQDDDFEEELTEE